MTKLPRRSFLRRAVSLPFAGVVIGVAQKADAEQRVEETREMSAYWSEGTSIVSDKNFTYNEATNMLTLGDSTWGTLDLGGYMTISIDGQEHKLLVS